MANRAHKANKLNQFMQRMRNKQKRRAFLSWRRTYEAQKRGDA